jgi:hypothetical protein
MARIAQMGDWKAFLSATVSPAGLQAFHRHERSGRPWGQSSSLRWSSRG